MTWTPDTLRAFELDIAETFNRGEIRAPIHLDGGNEQQVIDVFKTVEEGDWIAGSWRMHYKCLLAGVPPADLKAAILAGRSITLCFPKYRVVSSAIVAGILPIAMGIAWQIKRARRSECVHVFLGDMTSLTGTFDECRRYVVRQALPIRWIIEDNGKSVMTDTQAAWGDDLDMKSQATVYCYDLPWPHSGAGKRVEF